MNFLFNVVKPYLATATQQTKSFSSSSWCRWIGGGGGGGGCFILATSAATAAAGVIAWSENRDKNDNSNDQKRNESSNHHHLMTTTTKASVMYPLFRNVTFCDSRTAPGAAAATTTNSGSVPSSSPPPPSALHSKVGIDNNERPSSSPRQEEKQLQNDNNDVKTTKPTQSTLPTWKIQFQQLQDQIVCGGKPTTYYQPMPDPITVMESSHVIAGALLREHCIEAYRVYQRSPQHTVGSTTTTSSSTILQHNNHHTVDQQKDDDKEYPQVIGLVRVGTQVDGHPGIVHGGILAMLIDDVCGYAFYSLGWSAAFTANLSINYRKPVPAQTILQIQCYLVQQHGRKIYWRINVVDAENPSILYVDATSLFIIPKLIYEQGQIIQQQ